MAAQALGAGRPETAFERRRREGGVEYAQAGRSDALPPDIVVTATRAQVDAARRGLGWRIADALGAHRGGFLYDLFNGGTGRRSLDAIHTARTIAMTIGWAQKARGDLSRGVARGVYDVGAGAVRGLYQLVTTDPRTTAHRTVFGAARAIDRALMAENTPASVQLARAGSALAGASAYDVGYGIGQVGGNAALIAAPELAGLGQARFAGGAGNAGVEMAVRARAGAVEEGAIGSGPKLLLGEGMVGTYDDLIAAGTKGDNITPHHIPSANRMALEGVSRGDGIAINMEQPFPGIGGRHRATFTYGTRADSVMTSREALAAGVWDARQIYRADGLYTPQIRYSLQELIRMNKANHPTIFVK